MKRAGAWQPCRYGSIRWKRDDLASGEIVGSVHVSRRGEVSFIAGPTPIDGLGLGEAVERRAASVEDARKSCDQDLRARGYQLEVVPCP